MYVGMLDVSIAQTLPVLRRRAYLLFPLVRALNSTQQLIVLSLPTPTYCTFAGSFPYPLVIFASCLDCDREGRRRCPDLRSPPGQL